MFTSKIEIKGKNIKAYYDALAPEAGEAGRAGYKLKLGKDKLTIEITAKDAIAFRAIITSLTGLLSIVERSLKKIRS